LQCECFSSAAVGVGLYGNDDVHNGLVQFVMATQGMDDIITAVKNQVRNYQGCPTALIRIRSLQLSLYCDEDKRYVFDCE